MKRGFCFVLLMFCLFIISGCERNAEIGDAPAIEEEFAFSQGDDTLKEYAYVSVEKEEPDFAHDEVWESSGYLGEMSYTFQTYYLDNSQRFFLEIYNQLSAEKKQLELTLTNSDISFGSVVCVDVFSDEKIFLLFAQTDASGKEILKYYSMELDSAGNVLSKVLLEDSYHVQEGNLQPNIYRVDENGYCYILNSDRTKLYMFDEKGANYSIQEYSEPIREGIQGSSHVANGEVFWVVGSQEKEITSVVQYVPEKKSFVELVTFDNCAVEQFDITEDNQIYYIMNQQLIKWDRNEDTQVVLFSFLESMIPINRIQAMEVLKEGDVLLYVKQSGVGEIYVLSNKEREMTENGLVIADITKFGSNYIKACAAGFSRENPEITTEYISATGDTEDYYNRIMAEMVSGKGPDMMWVSREDMQILYEKGLLQDLTILLSEETKDQIFPGVLQAGSIEETCVGLSPDTYPIVLMTSNKLWGEKTWSFEEFFQLLSAEQPGGILVSYGIDAGFNKKQNLVYTILMNLLYSPYVNLETGESHFNEAEFKQALEAIHLYSGKTAYEGAGDPIAEGGYMAQLCDVSNISIFSMIMREYGETCHLVGFPGQKEGVGYWMASDFLVVNNKSDKQDEIALFLEYLLDKENQKSVDFNSVRRDVVRECVYVEEYNGKAYYRTDSGSYVLETKKDGGTYLEEYMLFLEGCGPKPQSLEDIENIISQEVDAYFNNERDLEEITKIIHNRVQLYLDEQK